MEGPAMDLEPTFVPVERIYRDDNGTMQAQIANRWAAFTDAELKDLAELTENGPIRLGQEIRIELERRAADGSE